MEPYNLKQSQKRILFKSILYRILGFLVMFIVVTCLSNSTKVALKMSIIVELLQTILYFFYENIWNSITWGLVKF